MKHFFLRKIDTINKKIDINLLIFLKGYYIENQRFYFVTSLIFL